MDKEVLKKVNKGTYAPKMKGHKPSGKSTKEKINAIKKAMMKAKK